MITCMLTFCQKDLMILFINHSGRKNCTIRSIISYIRKEPEYDFGIGKLGNCRACGLAFGGRRGNFCSAKLLMKIDDVLQLNPYIFQKRFFRSKGSSNFRLPTSATYANPDSHRDGGQRTSDFRLLT